MVLVMAIEGELARKMKTLEEENRLLLGDIDIIYKRIGNLNSVQAQNKLLNISQKKLNELKRQVEIRDIQIDFLRKMLEIEQQENFENELLGLLQDFRENRRNLNEVMEHLERFRLSRMLMDSAVDERNFEELHVLYVQEGLDALEAALDEEGFYGSLRADIYLFLAQRLRLEDRDLALGFVIKAWEANPEPKRLKELAFAYWNAEKPAYAIACLNLLPENYKYASEEERLLASTIQNAKFI